MVYRIYSCNEPDSRRAVRLRISRPICGLRAACAGAIRLIRIIGFCGFAA